MDNSVIAKKARTGLSTMGKLSRNAMIFAALFVSFDVFAAGEIELEAANNDIGNVSSLQRMDRSRVRSIRYRGWMYRLALTMFVISFVSLGWLGVQPADPLYVLLARIFSTIYFGFFLLMPYYTAIDKSKINCRKYAW